MSQNNLPQVTTTDLLKEDEEKITRFVSIGSPGFSLTDEVKIHKMMDLYLSGKTYGQIARIERVPKELVMLYSQRLNWYPLKLEYMKEMEQHLRGRIVNAKVASQDFLLQLSQMYQRRIGNKMDRYLSTGNEIEADNISLKEIDKYIKIVEALHNLSADPSAKPSKGPAVGINVGEGVTVTKTGENEVEITPRQKVVGSMLSQLANQRREDELSKITKSNDIKEVTPKSEGEGNENK